MRFHQLEADNQALIDEKMSAKARGARVERIQSLVALAASRPNSGACLYALEQMLKALSEIRGLASAPNTASPELYGGPVTEARLAQQLGACMTAAGPSREGADWADLSRVGLAGSGSADSVAPHLQLIAGALMARAESLLASESEIAIEALLENNADKLLLQYKSPEGNLALMQWVNGSVESRLVPHLGDMMAVYFDVYAAGGKIGLEFSETGALNHLQIELPARQGEVPKYHQDDDWLEDVIILFA